ncbi:ABC-2 transporter permease [Paraclostridium ghonii]|uniref:ABC-2 transporter permease n=1 Tax=Paraclostridium ghonii TaxID=29358 RepID=UPI00202CF2AC|nr:ABC-2 transporter permease [Paeniclostridium ghonii]MCM0166824.1 ABC-2 transporter permease [Paeniclostridium ghonii]
MENIMNLTKMSLNNLHSVIKSTVLIVVMWIIVSMFAPSFLSTLFAMGSYLILYQTMAYEDMHGIDNLISTLPVKRSDYVISRYVLGIFGSIASMVLLLLVYFIISKFNKTDVPLEILIITGILSSALVISVIIPIVLKFGVTKGKMVVFLVLMIIIGVANAGAQIINGEKEFLNKITTLFNSIGISISTIIISLTIITISMIISLKLYKVKEIK